MNTLKKMFKTMMLSLILAGASLSAISSGYSAPEAVNSSGAVDAGNKFCPVSGDKVSGKHFVEYNGKRYGLCCPMCENKFKKNPEKYLAQMKS